MNNFLKIHFQKWKRDYRHFICIGITLVSIGFGFLFPNSLPRLVETVRDLGVSIAYYFCGLFVPDANPINPTVTAMPSWQFADSVWQPLELFPFTWEEFKALWGEFWKLTFSKDNFLGYWEKIRETALLISRIILPSSILLFLFFMWLRAYTNKHCTERKKKSKPLQKYERTVFKIVYPIFAWCKRFVEFCRENDKYYKTWLVLWLLHFNLISIVIAFLAFYFYFSVSWDFLGIYTQVLKLFRDLTPIIRFIPGVVWFLLGMWLYNYVCRSMAFTRLYHYESCNRAVLKKRGIITTVYGEPGVGKTQLITSLALSAEIEQFDTAFEILLEVNTKFPNFPFQVFRDALKKRIDNRIIVDSRSCREWVRYCRFFFDRITARTWTAAEYQEMRKKHKLFKKNDYTFGYDFTHYRITYNDELKITHLFEALEDYGCAYVKFIAKTTLIFANYSIRADSILRDLGNMPFRDNDFFNRDPAYQEAYSHHAHIIDFDMLRLGKKMLSGNPKARRAPSDVWVVTEIDKEFKNMQELKETKINDKECNQRNDLHDACLMMIRHGDVIANRTFICIIADLQRPTAWGAGGRELGEVTYISEKSDLAPVLPFFSPYWLCQGLFMWIKNKWDGFYNKYIINRSDGTLFVHLCQNIMAMINHHYDKINGLFGAQTLTLEIQSGRMDGQIKKEKWRLLMKKDRSRRYRTSCLEAVFESYEPNTMYVDDFIMYAGEVGTQEENEQQNSFFQNDVKKMKLL